MARYYLLLLGEEVPAIHPMEAKKQLAFRIVERYHCARRRRAALEDFNTRFSKRDLGQRRPAAGALANVAGDLVSIIVASFAQSFNFTKSRGDARRLVEQGSVQINGTKATDPTSTVELKPGDVVRLDKKHAVRVG